MGKGDVAIEHVGLLSFKNYSLIINLGETYRCCALRVEQALQSSLFNPFEFIGIHLYPL